MSNSEDSISVGTQFIGIATGRTWTVTVVDLDNHEVQACRPDKEFNRNDIFSFSYVWKNRILGTGGEADC